MQTLNGLLIDVILSCITTFVIFTQFENAPLPIDVNVSGITNSPVNPVQFANAEVPNVSIFLGNSFISNCNPVQSLNVFSPIDVNVLGSFIFFNPVQLLNILVPISVIPSSNSTSISFVLD